MSAIVDASYYTLQCLRSLLGELPFRIRNSFDTRRGRTYQNIVKSIQSDGFCLLENYFTEIESDYLAEKIKNFTNTNSDFVHFADDRRVFGIENCLPDLSRFHGDNLFSRIGNAVAHKKLYCPFTVSGWLESSQSSAGSGGGWHRDSFSSQFKVMVYLTDVSDTNGPFQILPGSHKYFSILKQLLSRKVKWDQDRYTESQIFEIIKSLNFNIKTIFANKGTAILFDGSTIHRGSPILQGDRVSITNYYFPLDCSSQFLEAKFSPVVK